MGRKGKGRGGKEREKGSVPVKCSLQIRHWSYNVKFKIITHGWDTDGFVTTAVIVVRKAAIDATRIAAVENRAITRCRIRHLKHSFIFHVILVVIHAWFKRFSRQLPLILTDKRRKLTTFGLGSRAQRLQPSPNFTLLCFCWTFFEGSVMTDTKGKLQGRKKQGRPGEMWLLDG